MLQKPSLDLGFRSLGPGSVPGSGGQISYCGIRGLFWSVAGCVIGQIVGAMRIDNGSSWYFCILGGARYVPTDELPLHILPLHLMEGGGEA